MEILSNIFLGPISLAKSFVYVFIYGGWLILVGAALNVMFLAYLDEIRGAFKNDMSWVYLNIKPPKENIVSFQTVEQIFNHMFAVQKKRNWLELYMQGMLMSWFSLEMVSLGGKISFIIRVPKWSKNLVESAWYSAYPQCEISETTDYLANVTYDPDNSHLDVYGTEFTYAAKPYGDFLPLPTYRDFVEKDNPEKTETIIDPLTPLLEGFNHIQPWEFFGIQILLRPLDDDKSWRDKGAALVKQLLGEAPPKEVTFEGKFLKFFIEGFSFSLTKMLGLGVQKPETPKQAKTLMNMTEKEKELINRIERKLDQIVYETKIRMLYMAPKEKYDKHKRAIVLGQFRAMKVGFGNSLKPDTESTWTNVDPTFSGSLQAGSISKELKKRKTRIVAGYKSRGFTVGATKQIMSTEEIATLFHLPISTDAPMSKIDTLDSKKIQPPANLPIGEIPIY